MTDLSNAYFNLVDVYKTLKANNLLHLKRVHGGTDNEDTIGDLLLDAIEEMENDMEQSKEDVYVLLDRIVTLHELQASLEDIDAEIVKARKLLDERDA